MAKTREQEFSTLWAEFPTEVRSVICFALTHLERTYSHPNDFTYLDMVVATTIDEKNFELWEDFKIEFFAVLNLIRNGHPLNEKTVKQVAAYFNQTISGVKDSKLTPKM